MHLVPLALLVARGSSVMGHDLLAEGQLRGMVV